MAEGSMMNPYLPPHLLFGSFAQQHVASVIDSPTSTEVPASSSSSSAFGFLYLPHELFTKKKKKKCGETVELDQGPCHLSLHSVLSAPPSSEGSSSTVSVELELNDWTQVIIPSTDESHDYAFACPFARKPINRRVEFPSVVDCSAIDLMVVPPDFPVEHWHREFLETEINEHLREVVQEAIEKKSGLRAYVTVFIDRSVRYHEAAKVAEDLEVEMEGRWRDKKEDGEDDKEECKRCSICLEEIEPRWSEGGKLLCSHVFHWRCIAKWLMKKNTCPLCRRIQDGHWELTGASVDHDE